MKTAVIRARSYFQLEADIWYLALSMSLLTFAGGLISAFVSILLRDLGASFLTIGIVASAYNLALAAVSFFGGSLSARFGGKLVFILSLLFSLFTTISYGTAAVLASWALVALGLLFGRVAWGLRDTSSFSIVSSSTEQTKRATAFGLLSTLYYFGAIIGPLLGGLLAFYFGRNFLFFLSIPITATAIVLIFLRIKKGEVTTKRVFPSWNEVKEASTLEKSVLLLIVLGFFAQFFAEFGNPYFFVFMKEELGSPDYLLPLPQTAISVSSLLVGLPAGRLSDLFKRRKPFILLGSLLASLGVAFTAFAISPYMIVATFFLFGLSNVISWTCLQAYFSDVGGTRGPLIVGTYLALLWIGGVFSPPISGWVAETSNMRVSFLIELLGGLVIAVLLAIFFKEKTKSIIRKESRFESN